MGELAASISHELAKLIVVTTAHAKGSLTAGRDWMISRGVVDTFIIERLV
jgi:hypothetical protein